MTPPKQVLSPEQLRQLRAELQVAALSALMQARRWEPGELAFQGGTSLQLVHGSARFSEDLDFMVAGSLPLAGLARGVKRNLVLPASMPGGMELTVTASRDDKAPHALDVVLSGPGYIGSARVKIELWKTDADVLKRLKVVVRPVQTPDGTATPVPAITQQELLADKIYALGGRNRLKARDVYDTWWLLHESKEQVAIDADMLHARLSIYPNGTPENVRATAAKWLENASARLQELRRAAERPQRILDDLKRWLPSYWPLDDAQVRAMIDTSMAQLEAGIVLMCDFVASEDDVPARPAA